MSGSAGEICRRQVSAPAGLPEGVYSIQSAQVLFIFLTAVEFIDLSFFFFLVFAGEGACEAAHRFIQLLHQS